MARGKGRSGRRYVRDNRGRFATTGATARGGRLKTASGKKRETQTMKVSGAKAAGTISKPKGLKPGTIKAKPRSSSARQAASKKPIAKTSKAPVNKAKTEYKAARADARMRNADLRGADVNERRMANTAAAKVKNMQRRRSASVPKASADSPRSRQTAKQIARRKRATANERQAYDRWDKGIATDKDSRKASVAKRARAIYEGKIDPKVKTRARLTQTRNPDVLRDRIKRGEKLTAAKAKKAASKPKTSRRAKRTVSTDKVERIAGRLNTVATTKGGREGVKALNRTQVAVRAKSFLSRKAGGVSGLNAMGDKAAKLKSVKSSIDTRRKYSTQKPNRNKPGKFNDLGQSTLRAKNKAAQAKPASPNLGRPAQVTARGRTIKPAENFKPAVKGKSAPDNARTRANKLKTAQNRVRMYSETSSRSAQNAIANRNAALKARPQGTPGKVIFRSKNRASSRFQQRANDLTTRIRRDLEINKPGTFSATGGGGGKGIVRRNTGDKQTSLFGKPASLYTNKTTKSVKRRSGKRK